MYIIYYYIIYVFYQSKYNKIYIKSKFNFLNVLKETDLI